MNKVFVGGLAWATTDGSLRAAFEDAGFDVKDSKVILDRESGRSKGFGFVTLLNEADVNNAIKSLDGRQIDGRQVRVNMADDKPRAPRPASSGGGYGGGGYGGGGGGYKSGGDRGGYAPVVERRPAYPTAFPAAVKPDTKRTKGKSRDSWDESPPSFRDNDRRASGKKRPTWDGDDD